MKEKEENETNDEEKEDSYNLEGYLDLAALIDCKYKIHCCKYSPDSDLFVVGLSDGSINIYKKQSSQLLYTLIDDDIKRTRLPVTCIRFFNPPNHLNADHYKILIACYVTGFVKFWHWPSKSCIYTIVDKETQPLSIGFNRFFDRLVVGGYLEKLKVFDVETKKQVATLENNGYGADISGHSNRVYCVKYNPNAINQIFSGGWDDTVQIWDDRTSNSTNFIYGPHICGDSIDMDANHNHVLTGSWRRSSTLQIWDMRNFELIRDIFKDKPHMMIYGSQWSGTSNIFTCGSEKNSALLYDRGTMKVMGGLTGLSSAITSIDSTDESTSLLACSQNKIYCLKKKARLNK